MADTGNTTNTTGGKYSSGTTQVAGTPEGSTGIGTYKFGGKEYGRLELINLAKKVTSGDYKKIKDLLISAGEATKNTDATTIMAKWQDLINTAANSNEFNIDAYLAGIKGAYGGGGTGSAPKVPTTTKSISETQYFTSTGAPRQNAKDELKAALTDVLGRTPTAQEVSDYEPVLAEMLSTVKTGKFKDTVTQVYDPATKTYKQVTQPGFDAKTWLANRVKALHVDRVSKGLEKPSVSNVDNYRRLASDFGITIYDDSPNYQNDIKALESGTMTLDQVQQQFKQSALGLYPQLKTQFDAGLTLRQIASPALSAIQNILERDTSGMNMSDPLVQKYLQGADSKGLMPLYQYEALLKQQPDWQYTKNAHNTMDNWAYTLGQRFGVIG